MCRCIRRIIERRRAKPVSNGAPTDEGRTNLISGFGPEGGLAEKEIEELEAHGAVICGLGPRILRTETAPLYALSAISYQTELLRGES